MHPFAEFLLTRVATKGKKDELALYASELLAVLLQSGGDAGKRALVYTHSYTSRTACSACTANAESAGAASFPYLVWVSEAF